MNPVDPTLSKEGSLDEIKSKPRGETVSLKELRPARRLPIPPRDSEGSPALEKVSTPQPLPSIGSVSQLLIPPACLRAKRRPASTSDEDERSGGAGVPGLPSHRSGSQSMELS